VSITWQEGYRYDVTHPETGNPASSLSWGIGFQKKHEALFENASFIWRGRDKLIELKVYAWEFEDALSFSFDTGRVHKT
jgi:hypothetical protein